jgi:hypothetical protein
MRKGGIEVIEEAAIESVATFFKAPVEMKLHAPTGGRGRLSVRALSHSTKKGLPAAVRFTPST